MLFSLVAACFVATAMAQHDHRDVQRIKLTIYYESLCKDSINFFKNQLSPTYDSLKNYISVELVPFGKAKQTIINGVYSFTCHHGETECYGNIVQACALEVYHGEDPFLVNNCLMTEVKTESITNKTYPTATCVSKFNLQPTKIDECIESPKGLEALSKMGNKTEKLNPPLTNVPSVEVNMKFDYSDSKAAVENLKGFLCKKLKDSNQNVKECNGVGVVTSSILLMALSSILRAFISS